jgi:hypothetical protein
MCCYRFPTLKNKDGPDLGVRLVLDIQELFRSIVVLNSLFASIAWCLARPNWASMTSTLVLSAIWPFVDTPLKGQLLMGISIHKGVTQSDLISVLAVVVVAIQLARLIIKARRNPAHVDKDPC